MGFYSWFYGIVFQGIEYFKRRYVVTIYFKIQWNPLAIAKRASLSSNKIQLLQKPRRYISMQKQQFANYFVKYLSITTKPFTQDSRILFSTVDSRKLEYSIFQTFR